MLRMGRRNAERRSCRRPRNKQKYTEGNTAEDGCKKSKREDYQFF
jgi:hypothetical protein